MKNTILLLLVIFAVSFAFAQSQRLEKSPRHQEWVAIKNGEKSIHSFVVYPEKKDKATTVIVIHENKGLTDWVRTVADQLAEAGYLAVAPDLLSGTGPNGGKTSDFTSADAATEAIYRLSPEQVTSDLNAVADYAVKLPASNGRLTVGGFCWGGGQTFRFATNRSDLKAAFVFYGSFSYTKDDLKRISTAVHGFYGGNDARINATLPETQTLMTELGKTFEPMTYEGADHGFMRKGEEANASEANKKARDAAWERWKKLLATV
ncbi:dienelactone hydrolase family protein [bacterium]|nr:dienelactone hydrolase family protein [bacterium]MCI0606877.1 dienelactone hydrolase family protein [bacterium]